MKKISMAVLVAAISVLSASAQTGWDWNIYKYKTPYPGYIVKLSGDTINGYIVLMGPTENQEKVTFLPTENDYKNKTVYKGEDLKGFKVADKEYRSIHYSGGLTSKPIRFVMVNVPGRITRFIWYTNNDVTRKIDDTEIFAKADETPFDASKFGLKFAKFWSETLADYPELSKKVADKQKGYTLLDMYAFIEEYNKWWNENHK